MLRIGDARAVHGAPGLLDEHDCLRVHGVDHAAAHGELRPRVRHEGRLPGAGQLAPGDLGPRIADAHTVDPAAPDPAVTDRDIGAFDHRDGIVGGVGEPAPFDEPAGSGEEGPAIKDHAVPQRHGGVRPRVHADALVRTDLRVFERERSRMTADDVGIASDQHEAVHTNRPEGVEDGTAGPAHHHGAQAADRGQLDLAADRERLLVAAGRDLDQRRSAPSGRSGESRRDVGVSTTTTTRRDQVLRDHSRLLPHAARLEPPMLPEQLNGGGYSAR